MSHDLMGPSPDARSRPPLLTLRALVILVLSSVAGLLTAHASGTAYGVDTGLSIATALHLLVSNDR
jgi:hypothetical protein